MSRAAFWAPVALLAWVYAGYPLAAALAARLRPFHVLPTAPGPAVVTVGITVRDEAAQIEERVRDVLAQEVPFELEVLVASDGSSDDTEAIAAALAGGDDRIRVLRLPPGGQTAAQNAIFREARGDAIVLTDAGTRFAPGCLTALVAPFSDPRIGCTTGRLGWVFDEETPHARHEGLYWRYELWLRRAESEAGWLTTTTGAVLAVRRAAYREAAPHTSMDLLLPLYAREQGLRVVAVQEAQAIDRGWSDLDDEFVSRSRIATQSIAAYLKMAPRLTPWRHPSAFLAVWSHKLLRYATPWLAAIAVAGAARLTARGRRPYAIPLLGGLGTLLLAGIGYARERRGERPGMGAFPLTFVAVNLAFLVGWVNLLRGRRIRSWIHPGRSER